MKKTKLILTIAVIFIAFVAKSQSFNKNIYDRIKKNKSENVSLIDIIFVMPELQKVFIDDKINYLNVNHYIQLCLKNDKISNQNYSNILFSYIRHYCINNPNLVKKEFSFSEIIQTKKVNLNQINIIDVKKLFLEKSKEEVVGINESNITMLLVVYGDKLLKVINSDEELNKIYLKYLENLNEFYEMYDISIGFTKDRMLNHIINQIKSDTELSKLTKQKFNELKKYVN